MRSFTKMIGAGLLALLVSVPAFAQVPSFTPPSLQRPTFAAAFNALALPATGAGDAVCLVGSATKTIFVTRVQVSGIKTTAQSAVINLVKRTAANSGGVTTTAPTYAKFDSNNAAATAVLNGYTTVPTPGAGIILRSQAQGFAAGTAQPGGSVVFDFSSQTNLTQGMVLRGVAQALCVSYPNAFTTDGPAADVDFTWTEQ